MLYLLCFGRLMQIGYTGEKMNNLNVVCALRRLIAFVKVSSLGPCISLVRGD